MLKGITKYLLVYLSKSINKTENFGVYEGNVERTALHSTLQNHKVSQIFQLDKLKNLK